MIETQTHGEGRIRVAELAAPNGDAALTQALKGRMRELERLGLARPLDNGLFQMESGWGEKLEAMELHIDIRKSLLRARSQELARAAERQPARSPKPGLER
jgi:hypothetical protein